ncbi:hypothetical protein [Methylobacterium planeticum]|uniref:Uncharacterized protein n=1 Tax=Methylobacterium planeticum TaxID=2615211 RepID=A0A6N6MUV5_9HYPH|nr:hypothetical protein [Methylobacterium planeticum]KAB1074618.1 hypothetical protein F6X51_05655 [Methylobacterium planeticum]
MKSSVERAGLLEEIERQLASCRRRRMMEEVRPAVALTMRQWQAVEVALCDEAGARPQARLGDTEEPSAGFIVHAAVRYCLGRPRNAPCLCTSWLRSNWLGLAKQTRADIVRDVERHLADEEQLACESLRGELRPWREFLAWVRVEQDDPASRATLAPMARYRLEILTRGPRAYSPADPQIQALYRRGLIEPQPVLEEGDRSRWAITPVGRAALGAARRPGSPA